jgi:hypothetical protein
VSGNRFQSAAVSHANAVLIIASVPTVWGFGFSMTLIVLDGGFSVGALMSIRFTFANSQVKADLHMVRYVYGESYGLL